MHEDIRKFAIGVAVVLAGIAGSRADFTNTFDTGPLSAEWSQSAVWTPGPAGWAGGGAMQCTVTNGGYTLAGGPTNGPKVDFTSTDKSDIKTIIATGNGHVRFDVIVTGASFNTNAQWWHFGLAGNSSPAEFTALKILISDFQNAGESDLRRTNIDLTFAQLGWTNASSSFFELYFGGNSAAGNPIDFWIDNLAVYTGGAVVTPPQIEITNISYSVAAGITISGPGSPEGATWRCLSSVNAAIPGTNWVPAGSGSISDGFFSFKDPSGTAGGKAKFYRIVTP